jgi:hypothetical protein
MALEAGLAGGRPGGPLHGANAPGPAASAYRHAPDWIFGEGGRPMIEPVKFEPVVVAVVLASSIALEEIDRHGHSAIGGVGLQRRSRSSPNPERDVGPAFPRGDESRKPPRH